MEVLSSIIFQSLKYILNIREKERNNNIVKQLFLIPKKWNDDNYKNIKYSKRFLQRFTEIFLILWNIIFHKNSYISVFSNFQKQISRTGIIIHRIVYRYLMEMYRSMNRQWGIRTGSISTDCLLIYSRSHVPD